MIALPYIQWWIYKSHFFNKRFEETLSLSLSLSHWFIKGRIIVSLTVLEYPRVHTSGKSSSPWLRIYKSWKPDGATELHLSSHRHHSLSAAVVFQNGDRAIAKSVSSDSMPALGMILLFFLFTIRDRMAFN